jgi:uncharacterized protein
MQHIQPKGLIIGGTFSQIIIRIKQTTTIEIGELLVAQTSAESYIIEITDCIYGSQLSQEQRELICGQSLEHKQPIQLYENELRNYILALGKTIVKVSKNTATLAKQMPPIFCELYPIQPTDLQFLPQTGLTLGILRSGSQKIPIPICVPTQDTLSHHILVCATTGKGKSNLLSCLLYNILCEQSCSLLIFDPHNEYYGVHKLGLKDHPQYQKWGEYYSQAQVPFAKKLAIHIKSLRPHHFSIISEFSSAQLELMQAYHAIYEEQWIESLLCDEEIPYDFSDATIAVVKRRLCRLLDISIRSVPTITLTDSSKKEEKTLVCKGVFSNTLGEQTLRQIAQQLFESKKVIIDTSHYFGQIELLINSVITQYVFEQYKWKISQGNTVPVCSIVLEEAPRVLGKDVLEKASNVFSSIAKEGRKFQVGLIAITQLPSLIPKDILANMNTKIILGIELAGERQAVIESASQDLTDSAKSIASLDKGEAIVTSTFTRFAIPLAIPLFSTIVHKQELKTANQTQAIFGE